MFTAFPLLNPFKNMSITFKNDCSDGQTPDISKNSEYRYSPKMPNMYAVSLRYIWNMDESLRDYRRQKVLWREMAGV